MEKFAESKEQLELTVPIYKGKFAIFNILYLFPVPHDLPVHYKISIKVEIKLRPFFSLNDFL